MGVADANYELIYANVGTNSRVSDGGAVWSDCSLSEHLVNGSIKLPESKVLPKSDKSAPCVIVADDAFPLKPYLLKGTDPKFWSKIAKKNFVEKASSGMGEILPKILGGYEY